MYMPTMIPTPCYPKNFNHRPRSIKRINRWHRLCTYINRRRNGTILTRKAIMRHMLYNLEYQSEKSVDTYRNYLTKAGFLCIISPGKYEKVKTIPYKLSRRDVQSLGYDVTNYYKGW